MTMSPHSEYRFEDSPGLKHSCGICGTPLHHPRAKKTCFGKHAEPCPRFHHTMFRPGRGSSCDACNKSNEQHLKRHREIAAMINDLNQRESGNAKTLSDREISEAIHAHPENPVDQNTGFLENITVRDLKLDQHLRLNQEKPAAQNIGMGKILSNLGLKKTLIASSKKGADSISRLENAIRQDIQICANESREILKRQLGYYRYADLRAYHSMVEFMVLEMKASLNESGQMENGSLFQGISVDIDKLARDTPEKPGKRS